MQINRVGDLIAVPGADEVEFHRSLLQMRDAADLVVLGTVAAVDYSRSFGGEGDSIDLAGVTIAVEDVISSLDGARSLSDSVLVEFLLSRERVPDLESALREQPGVFFLRNKQREAERLGVPEQLGQLESNPDLTTAGPPYRLVSSQGIFLRAEDGVHNPAWQGPRAGEGAVAEGESADTLEALAESLRSTG